MRQVKTQRIIVIQLLCLVEQETYRLIPLTVWADPGDGPEGPGPFLTHFGPKPSPRKDKAPKSAKGPKHFPFSLGLDRTPKCSFMKTLIKLCQLCPFRASPLERYGVRKVTPIHVLLYKCLPSSLENKRRLLRMQRIPSSATGIYSKYSISPKRGFFKYDDILDCVPSQATVNCKDNTQHPQR